MFNDRQSSLGFSLPVIPCGYYLQKDALWDACRYLYVLGPWKIPVIDKKIPK